MANKLTGELRIDLSSPVDATALADLLGDLDEQGIDRSKAVITLQPVVPHVGTLNRDPLARHDVTLGMQLVATWDV